MNYLRVLLLLLLLAAVFSGGVAASEPSGVAPEVFGTVTTSQGAPIGNALVVVVRTVGCPRVSLLLMEAGPREIDNRLVRTDAEGRFEVPQTTYDAKCHGALMYSAQAFVANFSSIIRSEWLNLELTPSQPTPRRALEVAWMIVGPSRAIKGSESALCAAMRPEFSQYSGAVKDAWNQARGSAKVCADTERP
jgi:hypothetical protein